MNAGKSLALAALLLTGCGAPAPQGQVAAQVDGEEITDRELLAEAAASGGDLTLPATRAALLDRLIDRKLLAQAGRATLADRTPSAQIDARRAREDALARAYGRRVTAGLTPPDAHEIDRFMRANPHRFAARTSYLFDRLSGGAGDVQQHSIDSAAQALDRANQAYHRQLVLIDSDFVTGDEARRMAALAIGQLHRRSIDDRFQLDALLVKRPVVEPPEAQRARARDLIIQARSAAAMRAAIETLRARADIVIRADPSVSVGATPAPRSATR